MTDLEPNEFALQHFEGYEPPTVDQERKQVSGRVLDSLSWLRKYGKITQEEFDRAQEFRADFEFSEGMRGMVSEYGDHIIGSGTPAGQSVVVVDTREERQRYARARCRELEMALGRADEYRVLILAAVDQEPLYKIGREVWGYRDEKIAREITKHVLVKVLADVRKIYDGE